MIVTTPFPLAALMSRAAEPLVAAEVDAAVTKLVDDALAAARQHPGEALALLLSAIVEFAQRSDDPAVAIGAAIFSLDAMRRLMLSIPTEVASG